MKQSWKGSVLLAPVPPVLVSCGDLEHPNVLTVAWTGVLNTRPPMTYISLRPERYSYELIQKSRCFCINLPTAALVKAVDFCGCRSGRQVDKFSHCGLTPAPSQEIEAPMVEQSPVSLECRVKDIVPLGTHAGPVQSRAFGLRPRRVFCVGEKTGEIRRLGAQKTETAELSKPFETKKGILGKKFPLHSCVLRGFCV